MKRSHSVIPFTLSLVLSLLLGLFSAQPSFAELSCTSLLESPLYRPVALKTQPSQVLSDPLIEEARELKAFDDFKILSDLTPKRLSQAKRAEIFENASAIESYADRRSAVQYLIESLYNYRPELISVRHSSLKPQTTIENQEFKSLFDYIERTWRSLIRRTPVRTSSTLIPLPYPFVIPGSRFQEGYYWDSFFTIPALLKTGREDLVLGQIQNFLFLLKNYGMIPNGSRQYYLSRSQPPLLSHMVRLYLEHQITKNGKLSGEEMRWLKLEVFPLIKTDYEEFWMNPETRFNSTTELNNHFDSIHAPRPERHSSDVEEVLARTYCDVRAECESGKDFTAAFDGQASKYNGVMLNSILYLVEKDLRWFSSLLNYPANEKKFKRAADKRKRQMYKYLWDSKSKVFRDYNPYEERQSAVITADAFLPLYAGLLRFHDAKSTSRRLLRELEKPGGIMSSNVFSGKQWDAPYGWAPHHYFAVHALMKYGYVKDAERIKNKWIRTVNKVFLESGKVIEKYDVVNSAAPHEDGEKYITQEGFGWTNGVIQHFLLP